MMPRTQRVSEKSADAIARHVAADVYAKAGAKVYDMDEPTLKKWQAIARDTAWKDFGEKNDSCAAILKAAQKLL